MKNTNSKNLSRTLSMAQVKLSTSVLLLPLCISANECLESMCSWLQPYFSCCCEITASFVIQQLQSSSCVTYPHIMSALQLIQKVNNNLIYTRNHSNTVLSCVFHSLLSRVLSNVFKSALYFRILV